VVLAEALKAGNHGVDLGLLEDERGQRIGV
jgi:hypothetical protein